MSAEGDISSALTVHVQVQRPMRVRMTRARQWQHVGREEVLNLGAEYVLPDAVALALVATGAAVRLDAPIATTEIQPPRERAVTGPREFKRRAS